MKKKTVTLDVREDLQRGREPFARIMGEVSRLGDGESLLLLAPFEPVPLFAILEQQGFGHQARQLDSGDWEVRFSRDMPTSTGKESAAVKGTKRAQTIEVDARGLEPPQPLVVILEALEGLSPDAELHARTDRRPMHLYPQIEARGFSGQSEQQPDGSYITSIRRISG